MCFNACPHFNRYTERSTCQKNGDGLLPCELEETEEDADITQLLIHLSVSLTPDEREAALHRAASNGHKGGQNAIC